MPPPLSYLWNRSLTACATRVHSSTSLTTKAGDRIFEGRVKLDCLGKVGDGALDVPAFASRLPSVVISDGVVYGIIRGKPDGLRQIRDGGRAFLFSPGGPTP